jgi:hypothetical protein
VETAKSSALPFLPYPKNLEGYAGDVGFDPLGFSDWIPMDYLREGERGGERGRGGEEWEGFGPVVEAALIG